MKKILLLLISVLFTLSVSGQNDPSEINYGAVNTVTQVGDTLSVEFKYTKKDGAGATLLQFDFEYNNKLMSYLDITWKTPSGASKARNNWSGYKFNPKANTSESDMDVQYIWWKDEAGNNSYSTSADWSIERLTVQTSAAYTDGDQIIVYRFIIKDKFGTSYDSWDNILKVNWANYQESDGTQIQVGRPTSDIDLNGLEGGNAGSFTINLKTANTNYTDYSYVVKNSAGQSVATGDFDESGQGVISQGVLSNDVTYTAEASLKTDASYLDQIVTVSDLALVFAEAIGAGSGPSGGSTTFDYYIQDLMADVVGDENGVDFQDSYEILAYLQGVDSGNSNKITKDGQVENYSGIAGTYGAYADNTLSFAKSFTPTDSDASSKTIDLAHGVRGDVNFSHSWEPTVGGKASAQSSQARSSMAFGAKYNTPETANIDLISSINEDGLVVFEIQSEVQGMVGSQFNIVYDPNVIELSNVIFDTGNTMTNFSNIIEAGKVRVGSFDQNFEATVKQGTPYKLIFTPLENISNTSGLISFRVKEGVKADGTQINFNIQ
jgi:hypothetical protein